MRGVILIDWGTTGFRAWLVHLEDGHVLDEIPEGLGMGRLARSEFPDYSCAQVACWGRDGELPPVYMAVMVGAPAASGAARR